jgi:4-hydroxy-3-polyprenylbenzoate decarboxylase
VITGELFPGENKPEGPFGDHFGYYSLKHDFPVMRVHKVYHRKNAIWPFTVVGRPPQEDTLFGSLVHDLAGKAISIEIPGLHEVNAVDAAGVHPLLLAIGSERYTPYSTDKKPSEILTIANHILGKGQLSLAKYLFIASKQDSEKLSTKDIPAFFKHVLERIDTTRDLHFQTKTSIDTLDYSGTSLNSGSKAVIAAAGEKKRELANELPAMEWPDGFSEAKLILPGIIALKTSKHIDAETTANEMKRLSEKLFSQKEKTKGIVLITVVDDPAFCASSLNNWLWVTFTKSNPSHDIFGVDEFTENKHWGCRGPIVIDARIKKHHAPQLEVDPAIEKQIGRLFSGNGSLKGIA